MNNTNEDIQIYGKLVNVSTEGIVTDAASVWSDRHNKNVEGVIGEVDSKVSDIDSSITKLNTRTDQITETLKNIAATGGASVASAVTYDNATSDLISVNVQGAIDELHGAKIDKTSILQESGTADDKVMSQKTVSAELAKKFNLENIVQESGTAEDKVMSQKAVSTLINNIEAKKVVYNNEVSLLEARNVQEAIDEVGSKVSDLSSNIGIALNKTFTTRTQEIVLSKLGLNIGDKIQVHFKSDTEVAYFQFFTNNINHETSSNAVTLRNIKEATFEYEILDDFGYSLTMNVAKATSYCYNVQIVHDGNNIAKRLSDTESVAFKGNENVGILLNKIFNSRRQSIPLSDLNIKVGDTIKVRFKNDVALSYLQFYSTNEKLESSSNAVTLRDTSFGSFDYTILEGYDKYIIINAPESSSYNYSIIITRSEPNNLSNRITNTEIITDKLGKSTGELEKELKLIKNESERKYIVDINGNGDFTSLTECFRTLADDNHNKTIEIKAGVYDIFNELGGKSYIDSITLPKNWRDVQPIVPNNTKLIGIGNVVLEFLPSSDDIKSSDYAFLFSPLNLSGNCSLQNLTIKCKNCRYGIHDETSSIELYNDAVQSFQDIKVVKLDNDAGISTPSMAFGAGIGARSKWNFNNCSFKTNSNYAFTVHTNNAKEKDSAIITISDCVFEAITSSNNKKNGIGFISNAIENSQSKQNYVYINNCYIGGNVSLVNNGVQNVNQQFDVTIKFGQNLGTYVEKGFAENNYPIKIIKGEDKIYRLASNDTINSVLKEFYAVGESVDADFSDITEVRLLKCFTDTVNYYNGFQFKNSNGIKYNVTKVYSSEEEARKDLNGSIMKIASGGIYFYFIANWEYAPSGANNFETSIYDKVLLIDMNPSIKASLISAVQTKEISKKANSTDVDSQIKLIKETILDCQRYNRSPLYDKVIATCGDSITEGNSASIIDSSDYIHPLNGPEKKTWGYYLAKDTGCKWRNYGIGGTTLGDCTGHGGFSWTDPFSKKNGRYTKLDDNLDYIVIWFGINDQDTGTPFSIESWYKTTYSETIYFTDKESLFGTSYKDGTYNTKEQYDSAMQQNISVEGKQITGIEYWRYVYAGNETDKTNETFFGAYNVILPYLIAKYPLAKIALVATHRTNKYLRDVTKKAASKYGLPCLDIIDEKKQMWYSYEENDTMINIDNNDMLLSKFRQSKFTADNIHPNDAGYLFLSTIIRSFLESI